MVYKEFYLNVNEYIAECLYSGTQMPSKEEEILKFEGGILNRYWWKILIKFKDDKFGIQEHIKLSVLFTLAIKF